MILKVSKIGETPILSFDFPYQIRAALTPYRATDVYPNLLAETGITRPLDHCHL
jgi:hypothetical protein